MPSCLDLTRCPLKPPRDLWRWQINLVQPHEHVQCGQTRSGFKAVVFLLPVRVAEKLRSGIGLQEVTGLSPDIDSFQWGLAGIADALTGKPCLALIELADMDDASGLGVQGPQHGLVARPFVLFSMT